MQENKTDIRSCAVIGCGNVGATTAYSLMQSGLLSKLLLIDINEKKAQGEADDIAHALPFNAPMEIKAGKYSDISDCGIIIITAGANQQPGETRIQLVDKNVKIFRNIIDNVTKYNKDAIILAVTNPVDILTYDTLSYSGLDPRKVIGSGTVLDTARLKELVGRHIGVDSRNIHSFIIGEHGDSELAVWSSANVSGIDLDSFCKEKNIEFDENTKKTLAEDVTTSAYRIIEGKGATYYAIADSVRRIVTAIINDEHSILPISVLLNGQYGVDNVCLGVPCILGKNGVESILEIKLNDEEKEKLLNSANILKEIISEIQLVKI